MQIDGTTDSEYSMIVTVRDTIWDFVLYAKKYDSLRDDPIMHERIGIIIGELKVYMNTKIEKHTFSAAKHAIS